MLWGPLLCLSSCLLHLLLSVATCRLLHLHFPTLPRQDLLFAANWSVSLLQAAAVTLLGLYGCWVTGPSTQHHTALPLIVPCGWASLGYWLYDLLQLGYLANFHGFQLGLRQLPGQLWVLLTWWPGLVAHHIGIIAFIWWGVLSATREGRGEGMVVISYLMELSSVFVAARGLLARLGLRATCLYRGASVAMVASFFLVRVVLVPGVVLLYSRQTGLGVLEGFLSIPIQCQLGTAAFYSLNCYWFLLMLRGCVRAVGKGKIE